ncbi:MAG TPA: hypothetical protein VFC44_02975 [Candidatus Saccharimonadales bacterium]|nr:hypothetical protein [Candidatus Saccharimonadales bacterium]
MKHQSKLSTNQQSEQAAELHAAQKAGQEFESVEQLLRHDAGQVTVPPAIAQRLRQSIDNSNTPLPPRRGWWRRLLD